MRAVLTIMMTLLAAGAASAGEAVPAAVPAFARKPAAAKSGEKTTIAFAVDRDTDVAVYIEDAAGRVVRHLVAGVLGKNPPEPLKAGALEQSVEWDGKDDDGRAATGGPFKARVALGLRIGYAGMLFSEKTGPNSLVDVLGLAAGPDGRLYVLSHRWQRYVASSTAVHVFLRDGSYEKTIKPFHANLVEERVKPACAFRTKDQGLVPIIFSANLGISYYPNNDVQHQPAVAPDGRLVLAVSPGNLAVLDGAGGIPNASYAGPALQAKKALVGPIPNSTGGFVTFNMPYLAAAAGGKAVYLTGIGNVKNIPNVGGRAFPDHAVYVAKLPERGPAEVFFGDPAAAGNDDKHLSDPRGMATDGKGRLLVADFGNNRVVVLNENDRTVAGTFTVEAPHWVGVDPKSGAVYVGARRAMLLKFSPSTGSGPGGGWKDAKEVASADFSATLNKVGANGRPGTPVHLALDCSAQPPVLWCGIGGTLVRFEDQGAKFSDPQPAGAYGAPYLFNLSVDPLRREASCQQPGSLLIFGEATGKTERVGVEGGRTYRLGPDGLIYGQHHWGKSKFARYDRKGKQVPFASTAADKELKGALDNRPEGTTSWPRDFCVDRRGDVYIKNAGKVYHGLMTVDHYGPDGAMKRTAVWATADGALGPRVDPQGNIYMAECIKPVGQRYPEIFKGRLPATKGDAYRSVDFEYHWMYGSLVKYGPEGGAAWYALDGGAKNFYYGEENKLPAGQKREQVDGVQGYRQPKNPFDLQGARWFRFGFAYLLDMNGAGTDRCHCTSCDFDVDDFGRSFYPDQGLFRVVVADANGNEILHVGGYGNQDHCGPDSYVLDPAGKFLRPRKADDPRELKSPFAEPELAFNWFTGLAVSDRYLYVADGNNRRALRGKLDYAASETVALP